MGSRTVQQVQVGFAALPRGLRIPVVAAALAPTILAWSIAFYGRIDVSVLLPAVVAVVLTPWLSERDVRRFGRRGRRAVAETVLSGRSSGIADVDAIAVRRLERAAKYPPLLNRSIYAIVWLIVLGAPVLAGFRASPWWLCSLATVPVFALLTPGEASLGRPTDRLDRLRTALVAG